MTQTKTNTGKACEALQNLKEIYDANAQYGQEAPVKTDIRQTYQALLTDTVEGVAVAGYEA